ncbi:MAG: TrmH family RNA methyltransferase [Endomicrobiales bacterium]
MNIQKITSRENPRIIHLKKLLSDKDYRYEHREYVLEGVRVLEDVPGIKEVFVRKGAAPPPVKAARHYEVDEKIFGGVSETRHSQGVMAVAALNVLGKEALERTGRYVFLDRLQDPGNMGTIIRTACAFGFNGIIITPGCVDPFSPKAVRAAASVTGKTAIIKVEGAVELKGHAVVAADVKGEDAASFLWPEGFILAIGNEAGGLSEEVRALAQAVVSLPISGCVESLNAAVSAGILLYLARRAG